MNYLIYILITLAITNSSKDELIKKPLLHQEIEIIKKSQEKENAYKDSIIRFIPIHEGIRYMSYSCSAGHTTIGAGHVITKKDRLTYPITAEQVDSLILADVEKAEYYFEHNMPERVKHRLKEHQKWAIVHLIFCKGIGNFNKSTLKKLILAGKPINGEIVKWCYFHTPGGKLVRSEWSYNIRLVELRMYETGKLNINKNF